MKKKIKLLLRDILFLLLFFLLIGIVVRRIARFVRVHQTSMIHELDDVLLQQSEKLQMLCIQLKNRLQDRLSAEDIQEIDRLYHKIIGLEETYKKNSSALILLGPIGTLSIILKERQVKSDLLKVTKQLIHVVNSYKNDQEKQLQEIRSTDEGIRILQLMI